MPRVVFESPEQLVEWAEAEVEPRKYKIYVTNEAEIILVPTRSTPPIMYGYLEADDVKQAEEIAKDIAVKKYVKVYRCKAFEWKVDIPPGVKIPVIV